MLFLEYICNKYASSTNYDPPVSIPKGASFARHGGAQGNQSDIPMP